MAKTNGSNRVPKHARFALTEFVPSGTVRFMKQKLESKVKEQQQLKAILKERGWTYRSAASHLGVTYQWLSDVLNDVRPSKVLCRRIKFIQQNHGVVGMNVKLYNIPFTKRLIKPSKETLMALKGRENQGCITLWQNK